MWSYEIELRIEGPFITYGNACLPSGPDISFFPLPYEEFTNWGVQLIRIAIRSK